MAYQKWSEWLTLREDNARKRKVRAAVNGTGVPLPGSAATCPSTNPKAMAAIKNGVVQKIKEQAPDYSFDRWVKMAKEFGDDVNKLVGHADKEEEKLDKDKKTKEQEAEKEMKKLPDKAEPETADQSTSQPAAKKDQKTWQKLKDIHQERMKDKKPCDKKKK